MPPNTPIDSSINTTTLAFYNQLWNLWQAGKHVSAAWLSIQQQSISVNSDPACEWRAFKRRTSAAPAMVCLNGQVCWAANSSPPNAFGAPLMTVLNSWLGASGLGCLPLLQAVCAHGGAVQYLQANPCPALYTAGTTYGGAATTVAALNTQGFIPVPATAAFSSSGGTGELVCSDGIHPFTYTGLTANSRLNGTVISVQTASNINGNVDQTQSGANADGHLSLVSAAPAAPVYPNSLQSGGAGVVPGAGFVNGSSYVSNAWPLLWSATAFTTLNTANPTQIPGDGHTAAQVFADAQAANANGNLNASLDNVATLAAALAPYPLILRPMSESNNGAAAAFWYDEATIAWGAPLFKYIVGYLTGNHGYSGQPVTASPPHNILFAVNSSTGGAGVIGTDYPTATNVGFAADFVSLDHYSATWGATSPKSFFTTATGVSGYANAVPLLMECFTNSATSFNPYSSPAGSEVGVDLAGISSFVTNNNYDTTHRSFAASGTLNVLTKNGVYGVSYSSFSTTGSNPSKIATFVISSTAGVPPGSIIDTSAQIINFLTGGYCSAGPSVSPPATAANFILGVKDATTVGGCHFCFNPADYGGLFPDFGQGLQFQLGTLAAAIQDPATVNLPTPGNWGIFQWGAGQGTEWNWSQPLLGVVP